MWKIYKYSGLNKNTLTGLSQRKLWASNPTIFNDPFEFRLKQKIDDDSVEILRKQNPHLSSLSDEQLFSQALTFYQGKFNEMRVVCFSKTPKEILMWSHYANEHKGIVMGFCGTMKSETLRDQGLYPVKYDKFYPNLNFEKVWNSEGLSKILFTKSNRWKYEKEVRLIQVEKKSGYTEYPGKLNKIIFGLRIQEQEIKLVKDILSGLNKVKFFKICLDQEKYKLNLQKI